MLCLHIGMMTAGHVMYLSKVMFAVATSISVAHILRGMLPHIFDVFITILIRF